MMKPILTKSVYNFLLVALCASFVAAQEQSSDAKKAAAAIAAKRYRDQEPHFKPPPLPIQRRELQVDSGAEKPPSFFQSKTKTEDKAEARQFDVQQVQPQQFPQNNFNNFQEQPNNFQQQPQQFEARQQQASFDQNFQQFNNQPQQQQQNFQFPQEQQQQQSFQDQNNFQSRQNENLPTLPPVFIPPNQPIGPPPALQSPIRNLFRDPEPPFSLAGLFQRFLRIFNINN